MRSIYKLFMKVFKNILRLVDTLHWKMNGQLGTEDHSVV